MSNPTPQVPTKPRVAVPATGDTTKPVEKEWKWHDVQIDLGQSADKIVINEMEFHQGQTVRVREDLLPVLNEVMYNTKMHEKVVRGEVSPTGRRFQAGRY